MDSAQKHLWCYRPAGGPERDHGDCSPTPNGKNILDMNDLGSSQSIEDNTQVQQSIEDNTKVSSKPANGKKPFKRQQTSLRSIRRELKSLSRKITKRMDEIEIEEKLAGKTQQIAGADPMFEKSKQTNERPARERDSAIYRAVLQEGDGNLMVVCEPTGSMKTTYCKQVGNNNVMINFKMVSNRCQIINEEGKVLSVDSNGECWFKIKKRHRDSKGNPDSCRSSGSSSDSLPDTSIHSMSGKAPGNPSPQEIPGMYAGPGTARFPQEVLSGSFESRSSTSYMETRWPLCPVEHYDSCETILVSSDDEPNYEIGEKEGAILMKMEAPSCGRRLTEFTCLDECEPVQRALRHQKVIDFLQDSNFGIDMSVIGWEYEREEIYSTVDRESMADLYSIPEQVRKPVLPPRHFMTGIMNGEPNRSEVRREPTENSSNYDVIDDALTGSQQFPQVECLDTAKPPALPRRTYSEPPEINEQRSSDTREVLTSGDVMPRVPTSGDVAGTDAERRAMVGALYTGKPTIPPKSPRNMRKELPPPPIKPVASPRQQTRSKHDHMLGARWYLGQIGSDRVKKLLEGKRNGSFLVRDTTGDHKFTLEFMDFGSTRRLKIWQTNNKYHLEKGSGTRYKEFDSVADMMEAAMKSGIEVRDSKTDTWRIVRISPVEMDNSEC